MLEFATIGPILSLGCERRVPGEVSYALLAAAVLAAVEVMRGEHLALKVAAWFPFRGCGHGHASGRKGRKDAGETHCMINRAENRRQGKKNVSCWKESK